MHPRQGATPTQSLFPALSLVSMKATRPPGRLQSTNRSSRELSHSSLPLFSRGPPHSQREKARRTNLRRPLSSQLAGSGQVAGPRTGFLLTERGAGGPEMHSSARPGKRRKPGRGVPHSPMLRLRLVEHPAGMNPDPGAALPVLSLRGLVHLG